MNKRIVFLFLPVIVLACNILSPAQEAMPTQPAIPTDKPVETVPLPPAEELEETTGFTIVRLHPGDGDLQAMLKEEAQKATSQGRMPVVEFDAKWCPPCQAIDKWIKSKDPLMMNAYDGTYIIKLDVDEWEWDDGRVQNFAFDAIPVYFKLDSEGKQTGEVIDGSAWGEDIPENIAPPMDKFFHGN